MNILQAKQIPLNTLLQQLGHKPANTRGAESFYLSPLRSEETPSFRVNDQKNVWYDFGTELGGDIIDLVCLLYNESKGEALRRLSRQYGGLPSSVRTAPISVVTAKAKSASQGLLVKEVRELSYFPLLDYLKKRRIDEAVYRRFCREVHYVNKNGSLQRAIGFQNDSGAWEARNAVSKLIIGGSKDIRSLQLDGMTHLYMFEGFFDFLAYLCAYPEVPYQQKRGAIILNSIANLEKALTVIKQRQPKNIVSYLDNDGAGQKAYGKLLRAYPDANITNRISEFGSCKDFSEYWQQK